MKHLLLASALVMFSASAQAPGARLYDLMIEIGTPNLDENLRYATTHERRCLDTRDLSRAFPVLGHVSLQDCALVSSSHDVNGDDYTLQCRGGHGTTGSARWHIDGATIDGTLNVKLGGEFGPLNRPCILPEPAAHPHQSDDKVRDNSDLRDSGDMRVTRLLEVL